MRPRKTRSWLNTIARFSRSNSPGALKALRVSVACFALMSVCLVSGCDKSQTGATKTGSADTVGKPSSKTSKASSKDGELQFVPVQSQLGIQHIYHNGEESDQYTYLEAMGGGLGSLDFDNDGWVDLFFPSGGKITKDHQLQALPGALFRNVRGQSTLDVTVLAHLDTASYYSQGITVGDVNADGFADMLVTGFGGLDLFINQGDGTFVESSRAMGLIDPAWSSSAAFGDLDNDGLVDLYVAHYVDWSWANHPDCKSTANVKDICPPAAFAGIQDVVFFSNGDGTFRAAHSEIGLVPEGKGLGVVCAHLNSDQLIDVYVANDTTNNFLYENVGSGKFKEVGVTSGTALDDRGVSNGSMGIAVLDYDGNQLPDLWVCNYEDESFALYKNDGDMSFRHVTSSTGLSALGTLFVAFGTTAGDYDHDGDEDIMVTNGHVLRHPPGNTVDQLPLLLKNNGKGRLARVDFSDDSYFSQKWRGRGVVHMDFDHDGDLDLAVSHVNQSAALLRNEQKSTGKWCALDLVGRESNRDAIGAKVVFKTNVRRYLRMVVGGGSYMSQSPYTVHCAFPADEKLEQVEITWPLGRQEVWKNFEMNQPQMVVEGYGTSTSLP